MSKHHNGCAIYDDGQCTCDALPYPRDAARSAVATPAYLQIDWLERRVKELETQVERLRDVLGDFSEYGCEYGDNCPSNAGTRHGTCVGCKARQALEKKP